jgi:transposase
VWDRLHADLLRLLRQEDKLDPEVAIVDSVIVRAFGGGEATGPGPADRRKSGTKYTLWVDRHGVPIGIRAAPANASDQTQLLPPVVHFPPIGGKPGRPKQLPDVVVADRGFDNDHLRWLLAWPGVEPRVGRRRTPHGSGLGRVRWVAERTISWLKGLRRLRVRYDRLLDVQRAWNSLAASVICFRLLHEEYVLAA